MGYDSINKISDTVKPVKDNKAKGCGLSSKLSGRSSISAAVLFDKKCIDPIGLDK